MEIKVYFEPKTRFNKRLVDFTDIVSFSEVIRNLTPTSTRDDVIDTLYNKELCTIVTEDCSGVNTHVLENFEYLIKLFEEAGTEKIWIHNPPKFFLDKIILFSKKIPICNYKYPKITEKKLKKVDNQFDKNIIGQQKAKRTICRKLVAQMIRPSNKPLVLMFFGKPGIGKTETAKYLSKILYGNDDILREQMSMVGGEMSVNYFKSTSHAENSFSKKLLNRKSNVILLDEFALAPSFFHTSFFQMFDEGIYMDQNFSVDVSNSIVICTSNFLSLKEMQENIDEALLNRFDGFIEFTDFTMEEKETITIQLFDKLVNVKVMKPEYLELISKEQVLSKVRTQLPNLNSMRSIRKYMEDCVSNLLLDVILKK
jgi:ATP-dependent Clp protease ATP-binding subunit ClpA